MEKYVAGLMFEDADFATFHGTALWYPSAPLLLGSAVSHGFFNQLFSGVLV